MTPTLDERYRSEAQEYRLHASCEQCVYFVLQTGACSHGYPNETHRFDALVSVRVPGVRGMFCKEFEVV